MCAAAKLYGWTVETSMTIADVCVYVWSVGESTVAEVEQSFSSRQSLFLNVATRWPANRPLLRHGHVGRSVAKSLTNQTRLA